MSVQCKLGFHHWDGCQCSICMEIRDVEHAWDAAGERCSRCDRSRADAVRDHAGTLLSAARSGHLETVKALLKDYPELVFSKDDSGKTALHLAASKGHEGVVLALIAGNADITAADNDNRTAEHLARSAKFTYMVKVLTEAFHKKLAGEHLSGLPKHAQLAIAARLLSRIATEPRVVLRE